MSKSRDQLAKDLHALLTRWRHQKGADEYYELPLRSPYKEQVVSPELNRFGGGMGAYSDSTVSDIPGVSYINATPFTFEEDEDQNKKEFKYIGTMCPKINTFDHFWRMVWHKNTRVIVNLTHEEDQIGSEPGDKRERYWPPYSTEPSPEVLAEWPLVVETVGSYISDSIHGLYVYTIKLTHKSSGETRNIRLFWYSSWIDFGDSSAIYDESFKENALNVLKLANEVDIVQSNEVSSSTSLSSPSTTSATSATSVSTTTTTTTATTTTTTTTTTTKNPATEDSWLVVHCSAGVGK
jgi:protein tyrosine phosphatase